MKAHMTRVGLAGFVFVAAAMLTIDSTSAQCSTCATPTVVYQPVVVQPVATTRYTGWYPGKLLDQWRLRNYGVGNYGVAAPAAPAYTPYTASYAPYTASYPTYTAGYTPYVTAFAPLRRTVVARPLLQTVARPVVLSPVVTAGCSTCGVPHCGGCSACSTIPAGVSQASFTQPGCASCATSAATPSFSPTPSLAPTNQGGTVGPATPQPSLKPIEPAPAQSNYGAPTPAAGSGTRQRNAVDPLDRQDPMPQEDLDTNTFKAPRLFDPSDRTAQRPSSNGPTVDVWNAVYRKSSARQVDQTPVHQTNGKPAPTQAEIDADGWHAVPRSR